MRRYVRAFESRRHSPRKIMRPCVAALQICGVRTGSQSRGGYTAPPASPIARKSLRYFISATDWKLATCWELATVDPTSSTSKIKVEFGPRSGLIAGLP